MGNACAGTGPARSRVQDNLEATQRWQFESSGMTEHYLSVVYVSTATELFTPDELVLLLDKSRKYNSLASITGMLLHDSGNLMQVIEGPPEAVRELEAKIHGDPRHSGIITLLEAEIEEREFGDWSMAFRNTIAADDGQPDGYSKLLNSKQQAEELAADPSRAKTLLLSFRSSLRTS